MIKRSHFSALWFLAGLLVAQSAPAAAVTPPTLANLTLGGTTSAGTNISSDGSTSAGYALTPGDTETHAVI